jgi:hypothetical protein
MRRMSYGSSSLGFESIHSKQPSSHATECALLPHSEAVLRPVTGTGSRGPILLDSLVVPFPAPGHTCCITLTELAENDDDVT